MRLRVAIAVVVFTISTDLSLARRARADDANSALEEAAPLPSKDIRWYATLRKMSNRMAAKHVRSTAASSLRRATDAEGSHRHNIIRRQTSPREFVCHEQLNRMSRSRIVVPTTDHIRPRAQLEMAG